MQISLEWLSEYIELPPVEDICVALTAAGIEVEEVLDPASGVCGVVVGRIESVAPHANADRLQICQVTDGSETFQVVCGAPNARAGLVVPFAKVGASLPGFEIAARKVRGEVSHGMLCARSELGLQDVVDGLWELPPSLALGENVFTAAGVSPSLVLGITPNRPDCLSHIGIAREIAAAVGSRMKAPKWRLLEKGGDAGGQVRVVVQEPGQCPRYAARVVRGVKVGPSPDWLVRRLEMAGQRSINNVVDATNYVMLEFGQPLHAFDMGKLALENGLPTIYVRKAAADEGIATLDESEHKLKDTDLVIADPDKAIALAGVMGGASSQVTESTTNVVLESAHFEPIGIRKTSKSCGLHTDSSHRFERGADPGIVVKAIDRCAQILADIAGGEVAKGVVEAVQKSDKARELTLRLNQIPRLLGLELQAEKVVQLLEPLEIRCTGRNEDSLRFETPSFRPDLERERDLIEEVARRFGYDNIPERLPSTGGMVLPENLNNIRPADHARNIMMANGFSEIVNYAFGSPSRYGKDIITGAEGAVRILNPLGEEFSALRTTLLPGLYDCVRRNQRQGAKSVAVFNIGSVFSSALQSDADDPRDQVLPTQEQRVGVALFGGRHEGRWYENEETYDFFDLAGAVEEFCAGFGARKVSRNPAEVPGFNPYACAQLVLGDEVLGVLGQVHPDVVADYDLVGPLFAAEIRLDRLAALKAALCQYQPLPKFPGTRRDVAVVANRDLNAETVRCYLKDHAGGALGREVIEEVSVFDVYQGKGIAADKVSLAFGIHYRSADRTLKDGEVAQAFDAVLESLQKEFGVEIR